MIRSLVLLAALGLLTAIPTQAMARNACPASKAYVPKWGCVLKKEIAQAKINCKKGNISDVKQCLCQDGKQIGACGD